jgi:predicted ester cyclase
VPASGKTIRVSGITILRAANGKVVEAWQNWDMLGLMQQIQSHAKAATYIGG